MLTPLARTLKKYLPELKIVVSTTQPELFYCNPCIDEVRGWHLFRTRHTFQLNHRSRLVEQV